MVDAEKCNSCEECIKVCPEKALQMEAMFIDLEDKMVVAVTKDQRKKIRYTCSPCKPENGNIPCASACNQNAITCIWKPK